MNETTTAAAAAVQNEKKETQQKRKIERVGCASWCGARVRLSFPTHFDCPIKGHILLVFPCRLHIFFHHHHLIHMIVSSQSL